MNAPSKRGLRATIDGGIDHVKPHIFAGDNTLASWMLHPFDKPYAPGWLKTVVVVVLTFLGSLVNGWVFHSALQNALVVGASPTTAADLFIRVLLVAIVAGTLYAITKMWTYESTLRTYVYPEITLASVASREIGLVPAAVSMAIQFCGYLAAGGILKAIITTAAAEANLVNGGGTVLSGTPAILLWFGTTVIVFNYLYNMKFWNNDGRVESQYHASRRSAKATAVCIFLITIAFGGIGAANQRLVSYTSGLYVTGVIINGQDAGVTLNIVLPLLASAATGAVLYGIVALLIWGDERSGAGRSGSSGSSSGQEMALESAQVNSSASAYASDSARVRQRKQGGVSVNY